MTSHQSNRSWTAFGLGVLGVLLSWTPIGMIGLGAGVGAIVVGNDVRHRDRRAGRRTAPAATFGIALGVTAVCIAAAIVLYTIARAINDGTFG